MRFSVDYSKNPKHIIRKPGSRSKSKKHGRDFGGLRWPRERVLQYKVDRIALTK